MTQSSKNYFTVIQPQSNFRLVLQFSHPYLVSNPRTTAPIDFAAPAEARPATPPPMIST